MGCLTSTARAALIAEIAKYDARILRLETALDSQIDNIAIEETRFDSGDGSNKVIFRDPEKSQKILNFLISRRNRLVGQLNGTGIVSPGLRRQRGGFHGSR